MKILYVERKPFGYVSLEKAFRRIASALPDRFETSFQQVPFGPKFRHTIGNLLLFRKRHADIYHITGHIHYLALLFSPKETVLTIHDLRFLKAEGRIRRWIVKKLYLDLPVRRLKYVTAVSKNTKDEIVANLACDPAKIRIIDVPVFGRNGPASKRAFNRSDPTLLQVGTMPNKNLESIVRSISGIPCKLRIIGALSRDQRQLLRSANIRFENAADLSDEEMWSEYYNADIVTFCSTYEGFGLPIIEAQAAGKPVVTSNLSPMRETSGAAACLVDPFNIISIRDGIKRVIEDDSYRNELVAAGFENAERFRPEPVASQYAKLYIEVAENVNK